MRYPASEKLEIIRLVEQSHLPAKRTLDKLGIARRTFYRWYDRYLIGGPEALEDRPSAPSRVWNRIPTDIHDQIIEMALEHSELSPRELAVRFTDEKGYFVSEASVYRLLKAHDLITSPAYVVIKAADAFHTKTTRPNEMWQTDFTYFKIIGWGWMYLSTVLDDYSRYIIDRGLHDEINDGHYIMVDATDGRVHYVALDSRQDMDDLPLGAVVEVRPAEKGIGRADRMIAEVAGRNGGIYSPDLHRAHDAEASDEYIKAHVRRLEALRRQNIVERFADGLWEIPEGFEDRVADLSEKQPRYSGRVLTLSYLSLDQQVMADGATWLDRQLVGGDPIELRGGRFGAEADDAIHRRQAHLVERGLAERKEDGVRYRRNLLRLLRQRELVAAGERLARESGLSFMETQDGARAEGIYRRSVQLASGKFAVLEKSKEFTLVPWRPVLERQRGKLVSGLVRGSSVSFDFSRKKGLGLV